MAYDEEVAARMRRLFGDDPRVVEKKMFGGVAFMVQGNLACGVNRDTIIVRVGPKGFNEAIEQPHARIFDMTGRPMKGWVLVDRPGFADDAALAAWVERGVAFARSLPAKD
ncbi:MAG: TfoX/Sxy family protein [Myxococcales bacterium]|nr:TfoX/Sxy family protein [Myxococcales bacterium]